ncbi:MAG: hypothetical protein AAFX85_17330, partial [Pseudomonadota bacterium]
PGHPQRTTAQVRPGEALVNREYVETHNVIERYLLGLLTETERADFETLYFEDPSLLEELDAAEALLRGVRQVAAQAPTQATVAVMAPAAVRAAAAAPESSAPVSDTPPSPPAETPTTGPSRRSWLGVSLGLNGALAAGLLLTLQLLTHPPAVELTGDGFVNATLVEFATLRGGDDDHPRVTIEATDDWLTLSVPTGRQGGPFELTVHVGEHVLMRQSAIALPRGRRRLEWTLPGARLAPRQYELRIASTDGDVQRWPFSVVGPTAAD